MVVGLLFRPTFTFICFSNRAKEKSHTNNACSHNIDTEANLPKALTLGQSEMAFFPPSLPPEVEFGDGFADVSAKKRHLPQQLVDGIEGFLHHRRFVVGQKMRRMKGENFARPIQLTLR